MGNLRISEWQKLPVSLKELCIDTTLRCGQSFRWRKSEDNIWSCALRGRIISLRQDPEWLHYRAIFPKATQAPPTPPSTETSSIADGATDDFDDTPALLKHYFNLEVNLTQLYEQWALADKNFKKKAPKFTGVRILRQDSWEALAGFICSTNNNIKRISQMVEKLCVHYGPLVGHLDAQPYYDFPAPEALIGAGVEQHLRELGFGYRAKYMHRTAQMLAEKDKGWLEGLRNPESLESKSDRRPAGDFAPEGREGYRMAHEELLALQGVGPKVADCVCLFGLGWGESVPVDTHVMQIALRDYGLARSKKFASMNKGTYDLVANHFRKLWGEEAGWAHSVLFTADLKTFSERLVAKTEVKEEAEVIKVEESGDIKLEDIDRTTTVTHTRVKREFEEDEHSLLKVEETVTRRSKRLRNG